MQKIQRNVVVFLNVAEKNVTDVWLRQSYRTKMCLHVFCACCEACAWTSSVQLGRVINYNGS